MTKETTKTKKTLNENQNDNEKLLCTRYYYFNHGNAEIHGIIHSFPLYYTLREINKWSIIYT